MPRPITRSVLISAVFFGAAVAARAQDQSLPFCKQDARPEVRAFCDPMSRLLKAVKDPKFKGKPAEDVRPDVQQFLDLLDPTRTGATEQYFIVAVQNRFALKTAQSSLLDVANQLRTDQQLGPGGTAAGTTSLVTKAGSATLMGLALDSGVLTRSVNGTTATLNTNADELYRLISGSSPDCVMNCPANKLEDHVLNPLSFVATFSLAQSSSTAAPSSGQASGAAATNVSAVSVPSGAGKLTSFTTKFQVVNKYDPRSKDFQTQWAKQVSTLTPDLKKAQDAIRQAFAEVQNSDSFKNETKPAQQNADEVSLVTMAIKDSMDDKLNGADLKDAFMAIWNRAIKPVLDSDQNLPAMIQAASTDLATFRDDWKNAVAAVAGTAFSAQYNFNKTLNQPQTHDFTLILAKNFAGNGSLTVNGAASLYNGALPAGAKYGRTHYGQLSAEYDRSVTDSTKNYQWQFNLAGYWQYQPQPSILNIAAGTVAPGTNIPLPNGTQEFVGTAGSLWVTRAGFTLKGPSGVSIPFGVSWSNKTDLLQGNKVGAQIGINYNFSSIAGLF